MSTRMAFIYKYGGSMLDLPIYNTNLKSIQIENETKMVPCLYGNPLIYQGDGTIKIIRQNQLKRDHTFPDIRVVFPPRALFVLDPHQLIS